MLNPPQAPATHTFAILNLAKAPAKFSAPVGA